METMLATGEPTLSSSPEAAEHSLAELTELRRDLAAAARVQRSLLPESPVSLDNYLIRYELLPAGELAGDFVAVAQLEGGDFAFIVADVAGHGTAAALVTVLIKSFMNRLPATTLASPVEILQALNAELLGLGAQRHVCAILGLLTPEHRLKLAGAGAYPRPLLSQRSGPQTRTDCLELPGKALGLFPDPSCSQVDVELLVADRVTIVTDGLLELMPESGAEEKERVLVAAAEHSGANSLLQQLAINPETPRLDDVTWFVLERLA